MSELNLGQIRGLTVNNNVVTVPSGHTLHAPGHVLQVVQGATTTTAASTSTTFVSSGLSVSITPKFATSKLLISITHNGVTKNSGNASNALRMKLQKNSVDYTQFLTDFGYTGTAIYVANMTAAYNLLVNAEDTGTQVWSTVFANAVASSGVYLQDNGMRSTITVWEIAA